MGTPAELVEDGDPALASPVVGRTAYRIVREALTNVRKHAPGARVTVRVSYGEAQVRLTRPQHRPPGRSRPAPAWPTARLAGTGSGLGIASLRQRIELVHGTLRAGPHAGRRVLRRGHAARLRADRASRRRERRDPGRGRGRRADGVRAPAHDPRLGRRHRGRGRGARRGGRRRGGRPEPARRGADGPAHAGRGRADRDRADRQAGRPAGRRRADHLRRRPVRAARAAGRARPGSWSSPRRRRT